MLMLAEIRILKVEINVPENRLKYMRVSTKKSIFGGNKIQVDGRVRGISSIADGSYL